MFVFSIFFRIFVYKKEKMKLLILSIALFFTTPKTVTTPATIENYPCHPNGDLYPCTHPMHPNGDLGPCQHYDMYGNRIHTADVYPCTHPMHSLGDLGPCQHICY